MGTAVKLDRKSGFGIMEFSPRDAIRACGFLFCGPLSGITAVTKRPSRAPGPFYLLRTQ